METTGGSTADATAGSRAPDEVTFPPPAFVYSPAAPPPAPGEADQGEDTFEEVVQRPPTGVDGAHGRAAVPAPPSPRRASKQLSARPEPDRSKKRRGAGFWVFVVACVVVVLGVVGFGVWFMRQVNPPGAPGDEVALEIPAGMSRSDLVDALADKGVITSAWAFSLYSKINTPPEVKAGKYLFHAPSTFADVYGVLGGPPVKDTYKVTFPEGFTVRQVTERIAAQVPGITADDFEQAMLAGKVRSKYMPEGAPSYEGYLFPDTYVFEEGVTADDVLAAMVTRFDEVADEVGIGNVPNMNPYDVVKVASMIEKEARVDEDRAKIARVIYNRLNSRMALGIDATYLYALPAGTLPSDVNWKASSPYNTRVRTGLPPTPISNPGRASLQAAAHPEDGPWLYYVLADKDGRHEFTTTLAEHNRATADAKARGVF